MKLPQTAMHATRKTLREDYAKLFDSLSATTRAEMTGVWFSQETQESLKALVANLKKKP